MTSKRLSMDFFNGQETEKIIQVFDPVKKCEHCDKVGCYVVENDSIVGLCFDALQKIYSNIHDSFSCCHIEFDSLNEFQEHEKKEHGIEEIPQ
ncbi:MAG: hypothetical protein V3U87_15785 [Methylococcaceae bacterium]